MAVATSTQSTAKTSRHEQMLIDGAWTDGSAREAITVLNPGNRKPIASVPRGGAQDVDTAVKAAQAALPAWSRVAPRDRGRILSKIADVIESHEMHLPPHTAGTGRS